MSIWLPAGAFVLFGLLTWPERRAYTRMQQASRAEHYRRMDSFAGRRR